MLIPAELPTTIGKSCTVDSNLLTWPKVVMDPGYMRPNPWTRNRQNHARNRLQKQTKSLKLIAPSRPKKKRKPKEPSFWLADDDNIQVERNEERITAFHFKIRGNPKALVRHRSGNGHMYNPSQVHQVTFRNLLKTIASSQDIFEYPLFREDDCLAMDIVLRIKRPTTHFVAGKRGPDRIKPTAPKRIGSFRTDVDNNVKFVLDSMNALVYPDDRQVSRLCVTRVLDSDGLCEGSTEIRLRIIRDDDFDALVNNAFQNGESWS